MVNDFCLSICYCAISNCLLTQYGASSLKHVIVAIVVISYDIIIVIIVIGVVVVVISLIDYLITYDIGEFFANFYPIMRYRP